MNSLKWYKSLDLHQRIGLKEVFIDLCGVEWSKLAFIIPLRMRIEVLHNKLKLEGFDV